MNSQNCIILVVLFYTAIEKNDSLHPYSACAGSSTPRHKEAVLFDAYFDI